MIDTKALRQLAQSATPGPWVSKGRYIGTPCHMSYIGEVRDQCGNWSDTEKSRADAAFIAAANPAVITELLDRLEAAESECLEQARLNGMGSEREAALLAKLEAAKKDRANFLVEMGRLCAQCDALRAKIKAAEKSDAESLAMFRKARDERDALRAALQHEADCVEAAKAEIDALRAKIEAMEKLGPVGVLHVGSSYGEELQDWEFEANQCACDKLNEAYVSNPTSLSLYATLVAQGEEQ